MGDASRFEKLGRWLHRLLAVYGVLLGLEVLAGAALIGVLAGVEALEPGSGRAQAAALSLFVMAGAGFLELAAYIVIAVLFLRFLYKAVQQAKGFTPPYSYVSPGWAVGYWFIPFINLYRPYETVKTLFKACAAQAGGEAKPAAGDQLLGAWWAMFLVANVAGWILARSDIDMSTTAGITAYAEYSIGCDVLLLIAMLLFWLVLKRLVAAVSGTAKA